ncbi:MAG: hypothetical protein NTY26_14470, partial [Burkholderiales bacterium]|nr:hypothetical protein [Burkholderiales bacterium]
EQDPQVKDIKHTLLDAAELASRAGVHAANAGANLQTAAKELMAGHATQRKHGLIVLAVFGLLVVIAVAMAGLMSIRLQQRITKADEMLLAVGKRVIAMDESIKLISNSGEIFQTMSEQQDAISRQQTRLEAKVEELMKTAQSAISANAQTIDSKTKEIAKRVEAVETSLQSNAATVKAMAAKAQAAPPPAPRPDPAVIRREVKAEVESKVKAEVEASLQRQQKTIKDAAPPAAPVAVKPPAKAPESLVQYPKVPAAAAP